MGIIPVGGSKKIMFFKENKYIISGLLGWLLLAFFSIARYESIASGSCYFFSFWPACGNYSSLTYKIGQTILLLASFILIAFSAKHFINLFNENKYVSNALFYVSFIFILLAFLVTPFASADLNYYFNVGSAVNQDLNPFIDDWQITNNFIYPPQANWTNGIMYGPLTLSLLSLFTFLSGNNVIIFALLWKILMIGIFALCGFLIYKIAKPHIQTSKTTFFFFWLTQPLLLFEWISNGHFDGLWLILILSAYIFATKKMWWLVFPSILIGTWIKFIPILMLPWFVLWWWQATDKNNWKNNLGQLTIGIMASSAITYLSWSKHWEGWQVFKAIGIQSKWAVSSIFSVIYYSLRPIFDLISTNPHWYLTRLVHLILLALALYFFYPYLKKIYSVILKKEKMSEMDYLKAISVSLIIYLFIWQKSFWPWYLSWLAPLVLIIQYKDNIFKKIFAWISIAPLFFYIPQMMNDADMHYLWFFYYVVILIMAYPLVQLFKSRKNDYKSS